MIDESGMPDASLPAKTMNAGGYLASEASKAARRCLPVLYAKRDAKALGVSTDALIENTQKVLDSNLPDDLKSQTVAMMQTTFVHQANVDATVRIAVNSGRIKGDADPDVIDDEWVENYVEHVQKVSDEEVRKTWANLLIEEVNTPGSFSKRSMSILADMEHADAKAFERVCARCAGGLFWGNLYQNPVPMLIDHDEEFAISAEDVMTLNAIGLTNFPSQSLSQEDSMIPGKGKLVMVGEARYFLQSDPGVSYGFTVYEFTKYGLELSKLCQLGCEPGFRETLVSKWQEAGIIVRLITCWNDNGDFQTVPLV